MHFDEEMKASASGPLSALISLNRRATRRERLVPARFAEAIVLADQRLREPVGAVDEIPGEFAFDAGRDAVGRAFQRLDFQDVPVLGPDIEAASDAAIGADGFRAADARLAHGRLGLGNFHDRAVARFRLDAFDHVDHAVERRLWQRR